MRITGGGGSSGPSKSSGFGKVTSFLKKVVQSAKPKSTASSQARKSSAKPARVAKVTTSRSEFRAAKAGGSIRKSSTTKTYGKKGGVRSVETRDAKVSRDDKGFQKSVTTRRTGTFTTRDTKKSVDAEGARVSHERTAFKGDERTRERERVARGGRSVDKLDKELSGTTLWSFDLMQTGFGRSLSAKVDQFNAENNVTLAEKKKSTLVKGKLGKVTHEGKIETGTRITKPGAKLSLTSKGLDANLDVGVSVGTRAAYHVKAQSRAAKVAGVKVRNDSGLSLTGFCGAEGSLSGGVKANPKKGKMVASAGGEGFAGCKAGLAAETGLTRIRNGKEVTLAKANADVEGWAGFGAAFDAGVGLDGWKLSYKYKAGAAVGLGLKGGSSGEIDFKETGRAAKDAGKHVYKKGIAPAAKEAKRSYDDGTLKRDVGSTAKEMAKNPVKSVKEAASYWKGIL